MLIRILRLGKLARMLRLVSMGSVLQSLQLLVKSLVSSVDMLFWSFGFLAFLQCVAGLVISTLCREYIADVSHDTEQREQVFRYYGTFTRTFLTMFEICLVSALFLIGMKVHIFNCRCLRGFHGVLLSIC